MMRHKHVHSVTKAYTVLHTKFTKQTTTNTQVIIFQVLKVVPILFIRIKNFTHSPQIQDLFKPERIDVIHMLLRSVLTFSSDSRISNVC